MRACTSAAVGTCGWVKGLSGSTGVELAHLIVDRNGCKDMAEAPIRRHGPQILEASLIGSGTNCRGKPMDR